MPKPHADGSPITADELPRVLPSSINMTLEVTLGGQLLKSEGSFRLGYEMAVDMGYVSPNGKALPLASKTIRSGEYHAIGYNMQGLSQQQLEATKTQLEQAKTKLESQQEAQLASLTKHDITGAMLQAGVQSYFALNDTQDQIAQANSSIVHNTLMSFGTFSTYIQPRQVYGLNTAARLSGMMMDIDRLGSQTVDKDNQRDNLVAYMSAQGPRQSANEHLIPEALFDDPKTTEKEAEAVSAVKALQIAAQQGQKIFTITQDNLNQVLPQLAHKATVIQDVKNAVAAGKVVTISQTMISYKGWTGTGYILIDPQTGAGAYLIGGGQDGGMVNPLLGGAAAGFSAAIIFGMVMPAFTAFGFAGLILPILFFVALSMAVHYASLVYSTEQESCYWQSYGLAEALTSLFLSFKIAATGGRYGEKLNSASNAISSAIGIIISTVIPNDTLPSCLGEK